jgi:tRNA threonylcarbamoyladenosine biosynthesis protein TsaB
MVDAMLRDAELPLGSVDAFAVAAGPGAFTGLRIGVSAAKGLAWAADKPCVGVSTLLAMAGNLSCVEGLVVCAMDARRSQVYNALFEFADGAPRRLTADRAIGLPELAAELRAQKRPILVLGDGAELCYNYLIEQGLPASLAPDDARLQNAWGVCRAAAGRTPVSAAELLPVYLRLSQAERERLERMKKE